MAQVITTKEEWETLLLKADQPDSEVALIGGGPRRAYLWGGIRQDDGNWLALTVSGEKTLRKLAYAILEEVGG